MSSQPGDFWLPEILDEEIDLEHKIVRDSQGRRIDAAYVDSAVADVRAHRVAQDG